MENKYDINIIKSILSKIINRVVYYKDHQYVIIDYSYDDNEYGEINDNLCFEIDYEEYKLIKKLLKKNNEIEFEYNKYKEESKKKIKFEDLKGVFDNSLLDILVGLFLKENEDMAVLDVSNRFKIRKRLKKFLEDNRFEDVNFTINPYKEYLKYVYDKIKKELEKKDGVENVSKN